MACVWFYSSCTITSDKADCVQGDTWITTDNYIDLSSKLSRYLRSLHYVSQTVFTIGFGDSKPLRDSEFVLNLFLIQNAFLFVAYLFSSIIAYISSIEVIGKSFRESVSKIKNYLQLRSVSGQFHEEIKHFFDFLYSRQFGILEEEFLSKLPTSLRCTVMLHVGQQLRSVPFFKDQDPVFINICINKLVFRTFVPRTTIYINSDSIFNRDLILLRNGRMDIMSCAKSLNSTQSKDGQSKDIPLLTLLPGDFFGDFNLIIDPDANQDMPDNSSNFSLMTSEFTETLILTREKFVEAIDEYLLITRRREEDGSYVNSQQLFLSDANQRKHMRCTTENYHDFKKKLHKAQETIESSTKNKKLMGMMQALEQKDDTVVILPTSTFRLVWDTLCTLGIIYIAIIAPLRLQLMWNETAQWTPSLSIDYFFEFIMFCDIILRARFFAFEKFENNTETIVKDASEIWRKFYLSLSSYLRIITIIPYDLIVVGGQREVTLTHYRMIKIGRLLLLSQYLADVQSFIEKKLNVNLSSEGVKVLYIFIAIVIFVTWNSVAWSLLHFKGVADSLLDSFYFGFTVMTTTGFGDIIPYTTADTMYTIFIADIFGTSIFNTIIAFFVSYVRHADDSEENIDHRRIVSKAFLNYLTKDTKQTTKPNDDESYYERSVNITAEDRIAGTSITPQMAATEYFDYIENNRDGINETTFIARSLPTHFQDKFHIELVFESLSKVDIFHDIPAVLIREIALNMECITMRQKEIISSLDLQGLCYVNTGSISNSSKRDRRVVQKGPGSVINEKALFEDSSNHAFQFKAIVHSEIWYLSKLKFDLMIKKRLVSVANVKAMKLAMEMCAKEKSAVADIKAIMKVKVAKAKKSWFITARNSMFFTIWTCVILLLTMYNVFILPLRVAFFEEYKFSFSIFCLDFLGDFLFLVDIILHAFFFVFNDKDQNVFDHLLVFSNYRSKPKFWLHLLASMPTDVFVFCGNVKYLNLVQSLSLLRFNRFLRLACVNELTDHLYSSSWSIFVTKFGSEASRITLYFSSLVDLFGFKRYAPSLS